MACHCTGCQRMTASAFSLSALYPVDRFAVTQGDPVVGGLRRATRHLYCPDCKSWLFTYIEGVDGFVNVRAMMLDNAHDFRPFVETYTSEMLPWASTGASHSFEKFPPEEQFPNLMAEFAAQAG
ncbi:MAG: GFA family protein [Maricaulaceae bacterium]